MKYRIQKRNKWTDEEAEKVRMGYKRYGTCCRKIREKFFDPDSIRTVANIRDKIKTMEKRGEL